MTEPREPTDQLGIGATDMTDNTQPEALDLADWLEAVGDGLSTKRCAALLREQHARIAELEAQIPNGGGALPEGINRDDTVHGETYFTATDMATASAQGFRDGVASVAASAGSEPVAYAIFSANGNIRLWSKARIPHPDAKPLYLHPSPPEGMVGGWMPIETAPESQMVVVGWLDPEDAEHPERHDFDLLEDGCWRQWNEHAEHVEIIGGHGVSYTPPYTVWMPVGPIPTTSAGSGKGE